MYSWDNDPKSGKNYFAGISVQSRDPTSQSDGQERVSQDKRNQAKSGAGGVIGLAQRGMSNSPVRIAKALWKAKDSMEEMMESGAIEGLPLPSEDALRFMGGEAIDTSKFSGPRTVIGGRRNSTEFWNKFMEGDGRSALSQKNFNLISKGESPVVDEQWIKYFPEFSEYEDDKIIHHHIFQGRLAVPMPQSVHLAEDGKLHPFRTDPQEIGP
jgi:hypothetical protein